MRREIGLFDDCAPRGELALVEDGVDLRETIGGQFVIAVQPVTNFIIFTLRFLSFSMWPVTGSLVTRQLVIATLNSFNILIRTLTTPLSFYA